MSRCQTFSIETLEIALNQTSKADAEEEINSFGSKDDFSVYSGSF